MARMTRLLAAVLGTALFVTPVAAGAETAGDCSPQVQETQQQMQQAMINGQVGLAKEFHTLLPEHFSKMSCLERLMGGGLDVVFSPPSLSSLLNKLEGMICAKANEAFQQATAPLNQAARQTLPVGEIIPGVNLGSISGGVNIRARAGQQGGTGAVRTNLNSILGGGPTSRRDVYQPSDIANGLFGN